MNSSNFVGTDNVTFGVILGTEVRMLELPMVEPFVASHGALASRLLTVMRLNTARGDGWGECAALPAPTYTAETAGKSYDRLTALAPSLIGRSTGESLAAVSGNAALGPMTMATVEMAVLDAELRSQNASLASWLGASKTTIPAGAAIGLSTQGDRSAIETTLSQARQLVAEGFARLKLKVQPGPSLAAAMVAAEELSETVLQIDGNGSLGHDDLGALVAAARAGVQAIEQPFAPEDTTTAARLVAALAAEDLPTRVIADEAVSTLADAKRLCSLAALTGVSIKPGRVGGFGAALALHALCRDEGLSATAGGMVESGYGRHALAALAALPAFDVPGDVSPAARWLTEDPWPDLDFANGEISVPQGPGVGPRPDADRLEAVTVQQATFG